MPNIIVDVYFWLDVFLNFNTAFFDHERAKWVVSHRRVAYRYFHGWFALDLLSCLPFETLIAARGDVSQLSLFRCSGSVIFRRATISRNGLEA